MTLSRVLVSFTLTLSLAASAAVYGSMSHRRDTRVIPVVVAPDPSTITGGNDFKVTVTVNEAGTSDTVVSLSSSDSSIVGMPSSVTVPAGETSASVDAWSMSPPTAEALDGGPSGDSPSESVTLTASANGTNAHGTVTVN